MTTSCETCGDLPDFVAADLREGEKLPSAASNLVDEHTYPPGFWDTSKEYELTKRCPACGQLFTYNYYYEFSVGYIEERVWLERIKQ